MCTSYSEKDIEKAEGCSRQAPNSSDTSAWSFDRCRKASFRVLQRVVSAPYTKKTEHEGGVKKPTQIEDYRGGYPRFSALLSAHAAFHVFRRFSHIHTRLILQAQDKVALLEEKLDELDQKEPRGLYLGSFRKDKNLERAKVLEELSTAVRTYDELVERTYRMQAFQSPPQRDIESIQNWLNGNGCIARVEHKYLARTEDLLTFSSLDDSILSRLDYQLQKWKKRPDVELSRDPRVHLYPRAFMTQRARLILTPIIILILMVPVILCNSIVNADARLAICILSTAVFITLLSLLTKAKTVELAVAGATYATVLTVFISGSK